MTALYIVLPILLFIALLLFSRVRFSLSYDREIRLRISYLFVRIPLYPRKKKAKIKRISKKKKGKKPQPTACDPQDPTEPPPIAKKHEKVKKDKRKPPLKLGDIRFLLRLFRDVLSHVLSKASRHVRVELKRVYLSIGGGNDAARAAIEYGLVSQSVSYLLELLNNSGFLKRPKASAINVGVDFLGEENDLSLRADISCRLIFIIPLALSSLTKALTAKNRWMRHKARQAAKLRAINQQKKENDHG